MERVVPVLCPILLAPFPLLSLFAKNEPQVELSVLWRPLALCVVAAVALFGLFFLITKHAAKAGVLASLVVVAFFYYGLFFDQRGWFVAPWLALLVVGVVAVLRTRRDVVNLTLILAVAAAVMTVPRAITIAAYHADHPSISAADPRLWPTALRTPVVPNGGGRLPDIYVIIPDDYARADILKQYFHYDNSKFIRALEQRGFVISTESRSPYSYSELNIASTLNLDYLTNWPHVLSRTSEDFNLVKRVSEDNRAARLLTSIGYDYVHLDTDEVTFSGGNPGISALASPDSFTNLWMQKSILRPLGGPLGFNDAATNERFRTSIRSVFSQVGALRPGPRPKFVVFHTLLPHDPFIFGAHGQSATFPADADHTGRIGMEYSLRQLEFLNRELLDSIDQIRAHAKTLPVIVIQADEGFEVNPALFGDAATQDIRVKGLVALYLPGLVQPGAPTPPNTVNTLRFVFNHYLGTHYKMLESTSHLEGDFPYDFKKIHVR